MLRIPNLEQGWELFRKLLFELNRSELGGQARWLFALIIGMLLAFNGLNVVNSYVGRDFITAIAERDTPAYVQMALIYLGVFAASTFVGVIQRFSEERLGLVWRDFMTKALVNLYLRYPTYYRMNDELIRESGIEYADQRIADDVRTFTTTTLSFALLSLNSVFTIVAFSGVLFSISPWLFAAALAYAGLGTYFTVRLGRPLIDLNYAQLDKEAAFRSGLIHVRERAESVALLHRESWLLPRTLRQFEELAANLRKIIVVNRNMGFFTTGYNYLIQIVPIFVVAPLYLHGDVEFGVITQSAMAFATLVAAFSLVVTQFQSLSSYAAVVERLINLWYAIELAQAETASGLDVVEEDDSIVFENLTLISEIDGRTLLDNLNFAIPYGRRALVTGADQATKDALFKATAGIYDAGNGKVQRPPLDRILFLPERPYIPPGSLRQVLVAADAVEQSDDAAVAGVLELLGLTEVVARVGGLDAQRDWDRLLSLDEQRGVSLARILIARPRFAVLYDPFRGYGQTVANERLAALAARGITYMTFDAEALKPADPRRVLYDDVLELGANGQWTLSALH